MTNTISAIKFYTNIQKDRIKYKLVNGLFIIKYIDDQISIHIGDFNKKFSVRNPTSINRIELNTNIMPQRFNKNKNQTETFLGFWKDLNIKFIEQPIEVILN